GRRGGSRSATTRSGVPPRRRVQAPGPFGLPAAPPPEPRSTPSNVTNRDGARRSVTKLGLRPRISPRSLRRLRFATLFGSPRVLAAVESDRQRLDPVDSGRR